tara:strand:+ start:9269 stop:9553 length:285 start_codon:yes stop_codon:yes gene_type:complete
MDGDVTLVVIIENQKNIIRELIDRNTELTARVQVNQNQGKILSDMLSKNVELMSKLQLAHTQIKQLETINNTTAKPLKRVSAFKQARQSQEEEF